MRKHLDDRTPYGHGDYEWNETHGKKKEDWKDPSHSSIGEKADGCLTFFNCLGCILSPFACFIAILGALIVSLIH